MREEGRPFRGEKLVDLWIFYTDLFGLYQWHRHTGAGDSVDRSTRAFSTIEACYADAVSNGLPADARGAQPLPGLIRVESKTAELRKSA